MKKGDKVWFTDWRGARHAGVIANCDSRNGKPVFDISVIRGTKRYGISAGSLRLDVGELYQLRPLLGFVGNELAEVGG